MAGTEDLVKFLEITNTHPHSITIFLESPPTGVTDPISGQATIRSGRSITVSEDQINVGQIERLRSENIIRVLEFEKAI